MRTIYITKATYIFLIKVFFGPYFVFFTGPGHNTGPYFGHFFCQKNHWAGAVFCPGRAGPWAGAGAGRAGLCPQPNLLNKSLKNKIFFTQ